VLLKLNLFSEQVHVMDYQKSQIICLKHWNCYTCCGLWWLFDDCQCVK